MRNNVIRVSGNIIAGLLSSAYCGVLLAEQVVTDDFGNTFKISGFSKLEWGMSDKRSKVLSPDGSTYAFDDRGAFSVADLTINGDGTPSAAVLSERENPGEDSNRSRLVMNQLNLGISRETNTAVGFHAQLAYRWRSDGMELRNFLESPDVDYTVGSHALQRDFYEKYVGVTRPDLGGIYYGTQLARSWSRSNDFSYPVGQSGTWADSGAGFGIFPKALRINSVPFDDGTGKLMVEATYATNERNTTAVEQTRTVGTTTFSPGPTKPQALELFAQYSNSKNLIEFIWLQTRGAKQTSFGKSALVGWIGDTDAAHGSNPTEPRFGEAPAQSTAILQGSYWPNERDRWLWGIRRNYWSGNGASCNWNTVESTCYFGVNPGFNYSNKADDYLGYSVSNWDLMFGYTRRSGLYTYSYGGTYFGKSDTDNPVEWGQSNQAITLGFGVGREVPEIFPGLSVGFGVSAGFYDRLGPAPVSMPSNSFIGTNSLYRKESYGASFGLTYTH